MKRYLFATTASLALLVGCKTNNTSDVEVVTTAPPAVEVETEVAVEMPTARQKLVDEVAKRFDDERFFNAHWGILIESMDTGEVWYEHNADKLFMPASNEKIPTTASALLYLGPDFRYVTRLSTRGEIKDGTLHGDLVVTGNGDPTLYERFYDSSTQVFSEWAGILKEMGITRIDGNIIGDDNAWDDTHTGAGWPYDELTPWYYAEYGPLNLNENYVDVDVIPPDSVDGEVVLKPNLESTYYTLDNQIQVVENGRTSVWQYRPIDSNVITFGGRVVAGSEPFEDSPTITNPTLWYVWVLKETLEKEGIQVVGQPVDVDDIPGWGGNPDEFTILHSHQSPPLSDILIMLMKRSQNLFAETMVYTMGWKSEGLGTFRNGREVVYETLKQFDIDPAGYNFADGSGLSRYNYISPRIISKIYKGMPETEYADTWYEAQAIAGVDGTLRGRMKGTAAENNVRGKTGNIYATRSLSGYVTTAAGEKLVFSFLCNAHQRSSSEVDAIYDDVCVLLAEFDGGIGN